MSLNYRLEVTHFAPDYTSFTTMKYNTSFEVLQRSIILHLPEDADQHGDNR